MKPIYWRQWAQEPPQAGAHIVMCVARGPTVEMSQDIVASAHWRAPDNVFWCLPHDLAASLPGAHELIARMIS